MKHLGVVAAVSAVTVLTLGLASAAYAGGPGPYNPPKKVKHFTVYGEGIYAFQSQNHLMIWPQAGNVVNVGKTDGKIGFTVGGRYTTNHNSDMSLEYTRYNPTWKVSQSPANFSGSDEYQAINFDVGQTWNPVGKLNLRAFAGLGWRDVNSKTSVAGVTGSNENYLSTGAHSVGTWGIGPRVGFDGQYQYTNWLSLIANGSFTLPYGERSMPEVKKGAGTLVSQSYKYKTFLPELAANLALQFNFKKDSAWAVSLQGGYRVIHVFNATINLTRMANSASLAHLDITHEDITWAGPYIRLGVSF